MTDDTMRSSAATSPQANAPDASLRIAVLVNALSGGGAEAVATGWVTGLKAGGHEASLLVTSRRPQAPDSLDAADGGAHFLLERTDSRWKLPWALRQAFIRANYDYVISVSTFQNLLALIALPDRSESVIISEHNVPSILLRRQGLSQRAQLAMARLLYRRSGGAIGVSHAVLTDLRTTFRMPPERLAFLPNPIFQTTKAVTRRRIERVHVVVPGRIVQQKNPERALEAVAILKRRGVSVSISFIGDGPLAASTAAKGAQLGVETSVTPWDADWSTKWSGTGAVVLLASHIEGLGNVLVEAAEAGLRTVAPSTALGVGDSIVPGLTGVFALNDTAEALAEALLEGAAISDPTVSDWYEQFTVSSAHRKLELLISIIASRRPADSSAR